MKMYKMKMDQCYHRLDNLGEVVRIDQKMFHQDKQILLLLSLPVGVWRARVDIVDNSNASGGCLDVMVVSDSGIDGRRWVQVAKTCC